ncbi:MAG: chemotaxis response regulator protein-glutamate methylesterase [Verrucomicrobia bacterium]|jgi:two-component system response regulator WspF|nr:chemotaxis response regulator protein-glutamate methylesterase [Verrucomicrobiota bacterium]
MRIALVNDMPMALEVLRRVLAQAPRHQVAWTAADGAEAVRRCAEDRPDLILMDLIMPVMDGVEATRRIMAASPCAILVVTATVEGTTSRVFDALGAGALDAVNTPALTGDGAAVLLAKIDALERLIGDSLHPFAADRPPGLASVHTGGLRPWLFAIGASAGGPAAVAELLRDFRPETRAAIVLVQHLDESFAGGLAEWLAGQISLPVRIALDGDAPVPGVVLLPGRDDHLVLTPVGTLLYRREPADYVYRPSVDEFFESVVEHWNGPAAGVILTGMGRDGARGLKAMRDAHFPTFAQERASCAVYGMPRAAVELGAAEAVLPLNQISRSLLQLISVS